MAEIEHGTTYAAYQRCRRNTPGGACGPCKRAHAAWRRGYRSRNTEAYARERRFASAQSRAIWRLAAMHPVMFRALVDEELSKDEAAA